MRACSLLALFVIGCSMHRVENPKTLSVLEQAGISYVAAAELERHASIAVKSLPGEDLLVACSGDRCVRLKEFVRKDDKIWVSVTNLAGMLGLRPNFTTDQRFVRFTMADREPPAPGATARVGQLAPNFRVAKLDGTAVSLADFRGQRVLINSWASW
jgi:hypothetical protein